MNEIIVMERPDYVSWEDIRQTLADAHKNNINHGLVVRSTTLSGDQLREQVADGKCFVALDDDKVVGVAAVRIKPCNQWFFHGEVAHFLLGATLPNYQGKGIYSRLQECRYAYVKEKGVHIITTNTAANNERMVKMLPKHGFEQVVYFHGHGADHNSISWAKWLVGKPSKLTCRYHFIISKVVTLLRIKYKSIFK